MSEDYVAARVTADLIVAGLSPIVAPTAAKDVMARLGKGEDGTNAVREVARDWLTVPSTVSKPVEPKAPEPRERVLATVAGVVTPKGDANIDGPNPWAAGTVNITRQVLLEKRHPERAARLKREAGR